MEATFTTTIEKFSEKGKLYLIHVKVPPQIVALYDSEKIDRIVATFDVVVQYTMHFYMMVMAEDTSR